MFDINIIKSLCREDGISITSLCREVTGSSGNLETWKKGYMRSDSLVKIAKYFEVSTDYLLGLANSSKKGQGNVELNNEEKELIEMYRKINLRGKTKLISLALKELDEVENKIQKQVWLQESKEQE